jgi:hypothetical protein
MYQRNHSHGTTKYNKPKTGIEQIIRDSAGNAIVAHNDGNTITLRLRIIDISGHVATRSLGVIEKQSRIFTVRRKRAVHLHRKSNSYGFNHYVLENAKTFDRVEIIDDAGTYIVPVDVMLTNGKILYFKQMGFERQIFVPLDIITKYKTANIF